MSFLPAQVILVGVLAFPIVVVGIRHLMLRRELDFALITVGVVVAYVFVVIPGRPYYTAGMLPLLFAAGGCRIESNRSEGTRRRVWLAAPVVGAVLTLAFVLPVLPLSAFARMTFLHKTSYDLGETVGWPQLTAQVAAVYDDVPVHERKETSIFTANYGEAGALAVYGRSYGLPDPLSGHNTYWLWGPGNAHDRVVVAVGSVTSSAPTSVTVATARPSIARTTWTTTKTERASGPAPVPGGPGRRSGVICVTTADRAEHWIGRTQGAPEVSFCLDR